MTTNTTSSNGTSSAPKKPGVASYLDKLLGEDGLKTDVRVVIGDDMYYKLVAALVVAFLIITLLNTVIKSVAKSV